MGILSDLRLALRFVARRPGVPAMVAGLFALSIGLAGGLWAVVDAVALRPLPYPNSDRLVAVWESHPERGLMAVTPANFFDWSGRLRSMPHVAGFASLDASLAARDRPVRVDGSKVTDQFFAVFGVKPEMGRPFAPADFTGDGRVVVIAHGLWEQQFGSDPGVVGRAVLIDGASYVVIGVMPRTFKTVGKAEIWIPWLMSPEERAERRFHQVGVLARMAPAIAATDAERELQAVYRRLQVEHPDTATLWTARVVPLREFLVGDSRRALSVLGAAVIAVLLVACVNVGALLNAWLHTRRREFLVRVSLGASVRRVVRQLMTETFLWASAGLAGGVPLAMAFVRIFAAVGTSPTLQFDFEPAIDLRVIAAMAAVLVAVGALTTVVPALSTGRRATDLTPRRASATGRRGQQVALALQMALSIVLLCAAVALLRGFRQVSDLAGPAMPSIVGVEISLAEDRYRDDESQMRFFDRLLSALSTRHELRDVAAASYVPPARVLGNVRFAIEGRATPTDAQTALASAIAPGLFRILGLGLVRGRTIDDRDGANAPHVAAISRALARRYWPDEEPIGHRITLVGLPMPLTIVGVVDDARQPLSLDPRAESVLYLSYRQVPWPFMTLLLDPSSAPAAAIQAVREEVARIDPAQAIGVARPVDEIRWEWMALPRLRTRIVTIFGVSALVLALAGLYSRVAYAVSARRRELAIRQAIGAGPMDVMRSVAGEAFVVSLAGIALGLAALPVVMPSLATLAGGVPPGSAPLMAAVAGLFLLAATCSAYGPARRASRANPAPLLRAD